MGWLKLIKLISKNMGGSVKKSHIDHVKEVQPNIFEAAGTDLRDEYTWKDGDFRVDVVGEFFHKKELSQVFTMAKNREGRNNSIANIDVMLIKEPNNPYDKKAVRVDALLDTIERSDGSKRAVQVELGYLSREDARELRRKFKEDFFVIAHGHVGGEHWLGDPECDFTVWIDLPGKYEW